MHFDYDLERVKVGAQRDVAAAVDDDDDDDDDDDNKRRLIGDILLEYLFDEEHLDESPGIERSLADVWGGSQASGVASEASEGRSIVPQFPGEPLFYTPPTYWLQVIKSSSFT